MKHLLLLKRNFILIPLFLYGFFHHISASEFWPVTISKTWLNPEHFEYSLLQKPLFGLLLSLFHLLPLDDVQHLYTVKALFSALGVLSIWAYVRTLTTLAEIKISDLYSNLLILVVVLISPNFLNNFFNIRTDQVSFLLFLYFIYFNYKHEFIKSFLFLLLIPLVSIKGVVFIIPGIYLLYSNSQYTLKKIRTLHKFYFISGFTAAVIWLINLNGPSLTYLINTYYSMSFPNPNLQNYLRFEFLYIIASLLVSFYVLFINDIKLKKYAYTSLYFTIMIFILPQSYPYYIASLSHLIYLPLFVFILRRQNPSMFKKLVLIAVQLLYVLGTIFFTKINLNYNSNHDQISFIQSSSRIIEKNNLSYIDGVGILPRQKFTACFVSPDDDFSNTNCFNQIFNLSADAVIITNRIFLLGEQIFTYIEPAYEQILPNFWIRKDKINSDILKVKNLNPTTNLPITIF